MSNIDSKAFRKFTYGLFVLTAKNDIKDNGCIINTGLQVSDNIISIAVNKSGYTHDMIMDTKKFNINFLSEEAPYTVFEHFGMQSGRDVEKFVDCSEENRTENGILYLPKFVNAVMSGEVFNAIDCNTHTIFLSNVTESFVCSDANSMSYAYYFENVKPKPQTKKAGAWQCSICNYIYEGDEIPEGFVCPICHHGASDFIKLD